MTNRRMYRGLVLVATILFMAVPFVALAGTTKYYYDDVNKVIRMESGHGSFLITATAGSNGAISPSGELGVKANEQPSFTITAHEHYHIADIKVNGTSIQPPAQQTYTYTFAPVTASQTIEATFAPDSYPLSVTLSDSAGGSVSSSPGGISCGTNCSATFDYNTVVTLSAATSTGYDFMGWGGACSGTSDCTVSMDAAKSVRALFTKKTFTIAASAGSNESGTVTPAGTVTVNYGDSQTFLIAPNAGYSIADVVVDGSTVGTVSQYTFPSVVANHTISASFSCQNQPVRIAGPTPQYFSTLQAAYDAAADGSVIQAHAIKLTENLTVGRNIAVTIEGGYTCDYASYAGNPTVLKGMVQTLAGGGTLTMKNFSLVADTPLPASVATPAGGTYGNAVNVTLSCASGADCSAIYYTTDGTTPTTASGTYATPIALSETAVLKYFAVNRQGIRETVNTQTYTIDTAQPLGSIVINGGAAATNSATVTLTLTCNDGGGCSQMQFSNDASAWSAAEPFALTRAAWQLTPGEGLKSVYAKFKDSSGNWSKVYSASITLDSTPPQSMVTLPSGLYNTTLEILLLCSDGSGSGCDKVYYTTDGTTPTTASAIYTEPILVTATATLRYFAVDRAGNSETVKGQTYTIDTALPAGTITINGGATATGSAGVTLTLSCGDGGSCVQMELSTDGLNWGRPEAFATTKQWTLDGATDGLKSVYVRFKDNANNWSAAASASILLDTTAPVTTASPLGGTFATGQSVTLTCTDGTGSGCGTIYYTIDGSTPTTASAVYAGPIEVAATTTIKYFAIDVVANAGAVSSQSYNINFIRIAGEVG